MSIDAKQIAERIYNHQPDESATVRLSAIVTIVEQTHIVEAYEALQALRDAEWMMSHDWGGDRESILKKVDYSLKLIKDGRA